MLTLQTLYSDSACVVLKGISLTNDNALPALGLTIYTVFHRQGSGFKTYLIHGVDPEGPQRQGVSLCVERMGCVDGRYLGKELSKKSEEK